MQITEYKVASAETIEQLEAQVDKLMDEGWQPFGPLQVSHPSFLQTMIQRDETEDVEWRLMEIRDKLEDIFEILEHAEKKRIDAKS